MTYEHKDGTPADFIIDEAQHISDSTFFFHPDPCPSTVIGKMKKGLSIFAIRPVVLRFAFNFAMAMERKLRLNDHKGGWEDLDSETLWDLLMKEVGELRDEMMTESQFSQLEAIDVANICMMIWDHYRKSYRKSDSIK